MPTTILDLFNTNNNRFADTYEVPRRSNNWEAGFDGDGDGGGGLQSRRSSLYNQTLFFHLMSLSDKFTKPINHNYFFFYPDETKNSYRKRILPTPGHVSPSLIIPINYVLSTSGALRYV